VKPFSLVNSGSIVKVTHARCQKEPKNLGYKSFVSKDVVKSIIFRKES